MILILTNNKSLIKNEDVYCLETLGNLLKLARNDKTLFEPISKKYLNIFIYFNNHFFRIKTIVTLILKNQILLNKEDRFEELVKFIVDIMK